MIGEISLLPLVVSIPAVILIGFTILDVVRRPDLSLWRKTLWIGTVVVLPVVGTFIYLLARPFRDPAQTPVERNERARELISLIRDHERGDLSDDEFASVKASTFGAALGHS